MFNPVYAAAITARVRARLLETVIDNKLEDSIIGFATDCLYLKTPPPQHVVGQGLGAWKLEAGPCEGLFIGSGVYALKSPGYKINHFRGFKTKHDLFASLAQGITSFTTERPVKLREGIKGGVRTADGKTRPVSWEDIGSFLPQTKTLDLAFDKKRKWDWDPKKASDLLNNQIESRALILGVDR